MLDLIQYLTDAFPTLDVYMQDESTLVVGEVYYETGTGHGLHHVTFNDRRVVLTPEFDTQCGEAVVFDARYRNRDLLPSFDMQEHVEGHPIEDWESETCGALDETYPVYMMGSLTFMPSDIIRTDQPAFREAVQEYMDSVVDGGTCPICEN